MRTAGGAFTSVRHFGHCTATALHTMAVRPSPVPARIIKTPVSPDPSSGVTPEDEAVLGNAGIEVEVWISASDSYIHQMKIDVSTTQFTWGVIYHFSDFVKGGGPASA